MNCYKQSLYVGIIRIMANVLMLCALFFAMFMASRSQMDSFSTFGLYFFGTTIPVWMLAFYATRKVRELFRADDMSVVDLPRLGRCLVRWRVRDTGPYGVVYAR